ncbi:MAG: 30S ribosome-binding factor RbfA [candidate division Zixibacteria bacterium]|nr:30S ribosome-binding factor RbfA [candidate division Zixibacteria bacterium]
MKDFSRADRLSSQIARELSEILLYYRAVPANTIITIVEVEMSRDLRVGKVYYSVYGDDNAAEKADIFFRDHHKQIRSELAGKIRIKFMPELKFEYDQAIERGLRINELLNRIKKDDR